MANITKDLVPPIVNLGPDTVVFTIGDVSWEKFTLDELRTYLEQTINFPTPPPSSGPSLVIREKVLTQGDLSAWVRYANVGGGAPTLASASAGNYTLTIPANTTLLGVTITGDDRTAQAGGDMVFAINNTANNQTLFFNVQLISNANNQLRNDLDVLGIVITQNGSAGTTSLNLTSMNGFGRDGFKIIVR